MYSELRKTSLIEKVIKLENEAVLLELEAAINKKPIAKEKNSTIFDFVGMLSKKEGAEMRKAIEESCETFAA